MSNLLKKVKIFTNSLLGGSSSATWGSITGTLSSQTDLQNSLDNKQDSDADLTTIAAINSGTSGVLASDGSGWIMKTYNSVKSALGLTKSDVGLSNVVNTDTTTTTNITDSTNKRFVTDANLTTLSNTSGVNTGDETQSSIVTKLNLNSGTVNIDFGNDGVLTENDLVITTVLAPWVTNTTEITCFVENDGVDHTDEDAYLENIIATVYNIVPNTSFDIIAVAHNLTWGKYKITYKQII
jgi:hypothetical protein